MGPFSFQEKENVDLREELGKAIDGETDAAGTESVTEVVASETPTEPAAEPKAAEPAAEAPSGDRPRDANGRFLPKSEEPAKAEAQPQSAPGPQAPQAAEAPKEPQQQVVDLPPSTWTALAKAEYAKLPEVVRNEIKKRESDFQKGISGYKQAADYGQRMQQTLQPFMPLIQQAGGQPEAVVRNLLQTAATLRTGSPQQKQQLLVQIAQEYGVPLPGQQAQETPAGQFDPNALAPVVQQLLAPHLQKFEQISSRFTTAEQQREQKEQEALASQIEAFRTATDSSGQPKHMYFDNVRGTMAALIDSGDAATLEDAYVMACRAHPEVSQILAAEQAKKADAQRLAEAKRLAEEARRATTVNAQGQGGVGLADTSKLSLRDELAAQIDGAARIA
jgi:hypothetical protein